MQFALHFYEGLLFIIMGAKGKIVEKIISIKEIYAKTNNGYDIFRWELGNISLSREFSHPLRHDRHPSASLIKNDGVWLLKDYTGKIPVMNAIQFLEERYGISFKDAIKKAAGDFGVQSSLPPVKITWTTPEEHEYSHISFSTCRFDKHHHAWWNAYHLSEIFLLSENVYRVKDWALDRRRMIMNAEELTFAYYAEDIDRVKIMRIGVDKKLKWKTNAPNNYIWGVEKINAPCEKLIISKARKDELVLRYLGVCAVSVQSEQISCISQNVEKLSTLGKNLYVNFGSDPQGKTESNKITQEFGYKHYNTPDEYLPDINDTAELAKHDINILRSHLMQKGFLA